MLSSPCTDERGFVASLSTLDDIAVLAETEEVQCKLATGRDGQGQLPNDLWPTYSVFANTQGGCIFIGLKETSRGFELIGLAWQTRRSSALNDLLRMRKSGIQQPPPEAWGLRLQRRLPLDPSVPGSWPTYAPSARDIHKQLDRPEPAVSRLRELLTQPGRGTPFKAVAGGTGIARQSG